MVINSNEELEEQNYVSEKNQSEKFFSLIWLFVLLALFLIIWLCSQMLSSFLNNGIEDNPFLKVTNRQMSLFLWQNPEKMRSNVKQKTGYMPGFQSAPVIVPSTEYADQYVIAPPETLFLYHIWEQLVGGYVIPKTIPNQEFQEFLATDEQWQPHFWKETPEGYKKFIENLPNVKIVDLQSLSEADLPIVVRQAFWGWKNYMKEGKEINALKPTYEEMSVFLERYPNYNRHYWQNLFPQYLENLGSMQGVIPNVELPPFLRVAFYNWHTTH